MRSITPQSYMTVADDKAEADRIMALACVEPRDVREITVTDQHAVLELVTRDAHGKIVVDLKASEIVTRTMVVPL